MIYFIRHSERIDYVDPKKWKNSKRYQENENDPVLSSGGAKIATDQLEKLMNEKYDGHSKIDFIYSSPFARCIETSIAFRKYILKKYKKDVKIRIDFGLSPQIPGDWIFWLFDKASENISFRGGKFVAKSVKFLDDQMKLKNIYKKYDNNNFDVEYESNLSFNDINDEFGEKYSYQKSVNNRLEAVSKIVDILLDGFSLVVTHGEVIMAIKNLLEKEWKTDKDNLFGGKNYCGGLECKKVRNKLSLVSVVSGSSH